LAFGHRADIRDRQAAFARNGEDFCLGRWLDGDKQAATRLRVAENFSLQLG